MQIIDTSEFESSKVVLRKTSLVDYPGKLAAVIFFPICNLRCPWCQNRELVLNETTKDLIPLSEAIKYIEKRKNVLNSIVLSGGEPTLFSNIHILISHLKSLGFFVKIDTNGTNPGVLQDLINNKDSCPNYIAFDLKFSLDRYNTLLNSTETTNTISENVKAGIKIICSSNIDHEFRSLVFPDNFFSRQDIENLSKLAGNSKWHFRPFVPGNCLDPEWNKKEKTPAHIVQELIDFAESLKKNPPQEHL
ncbi:MAG: anaerobic ribonucleoside-triphosphate reductase activating protein [Spirochaetaceae bacterium]|jgi:pyruvate formate lyase activating enzyme|nr:anaerobic ribonucleoside-triphosphate reductase activating protein [Spirochaetaceae bacterium]